MTNKLSNHSGPVESLAPAAARLFESLSRHVGGCIAQIVPLDCCYAIGATVTPIHRLQLPIVGSDGTHTWAVGGVLVQRCDSNHYGPCRYHVIQRDSFGERFTVCEVAIAGDDEIHVTSVLEYRPITICTGRCDVCDSADCDIVLGRWR
jgi:hypothetical protein